MLKSKFSEIQVMHHTNVGTTGTIRRNLQTTIIYHFLQTQIQLHMEKKTLDKSSIIILLLLRITENSNGFSPNVRT
ncbi:hypothetical protein T10_2723, partial [Trichinella papuae]